MGSHDFSWCLKCVWCSLGRGLSLVSIRYVLLGSVIRKHCVWQNPQKNIRPSQGCVVMYVLPVKLLIWKQTVSELISCLNLWLLLLPGINYVKCMYGHYRVFFLPVINCHKDRHVALYLITGKLELPLWIPNDCSISYNW